MGNRCSSPGRVSQPVQRDIEKVAEIGVDAMVSTVLEAGEQLPVVGGLIKLLAHIKDKYAEIAEQVEAADDIAAWAAKASNLLTPIEARLSNPGADSPLDAEMRVLVKDAATKLGALVSVAEHITSGSKPANFVRSALFKEELEGAKAAFETTMERLKTAVLIDTNVAVHGMDVKLDKLDEMVRLLFDKVEASGRSSDDKQSLAGLVATVRARPAMADVVARVVDGDGAGATAALDALPADARTSAEAKFAEGEALKARGDYAGAVTAYRAAVERDPKMSGAFFALGVAEFNRNGRKPADAHVCLGNLLDDRKQYDAAEGMYRKAIQIDPEHAIAHANLGILLKDVRKDLAGAEAMFRKAIQIDPEHAGARRNLGNLLQATQLGPRRR